MALQKKNNEKYNPSYCELRYLNPFPDTHPLISAMCAQPNEHQNKQTPD
jgi:hypothetical protein